jgi:hypothetical protein
MHTVLLGFGAALLVASIAVLAFIFVAVPRRDVGHEEFMEAWSEQQAIEEKPLQLHGEIEPGLRAEDDPSTSKRGGAKGRRVQ